MKEHKRGYEEIVHGDQLYAIILRANFSSDSIVFLTPPEFSQQMGYLPHRKGAVIKAHFHKPVPREIVYTQEALFIRKGKIKVTFYDKMKDTIGFAILQEGDAILLCTGGHGFEMLEDSQIIEIKQGPYVGEDDKERF